LTPRNGNTRLVQRSRFEGLNWLAGLLLRVLRQRQIPGENRQTLARIKALLET
jgi:hypothetical protein